MNSDEEVLDNPERKPIDSIKSDNRVFKDLTIVVGVIYLILSLIFAYAAYSVISWWIDTLKGFGYGMEEIKWFRVIIRSSPGLIYASYFFIGAIGLFRRSAWGWAVSLSISIFALIFPLILLLADLFYSTSSSDLPNWVLFLMTLLFGLIVIYLLVKPTRKIFNPSRKSYVLVVVSVFALIVHRFLMPLIF